MSSATRSFDEWWQQHFSSDLDPSGLGSERNILRYRPVDGVVLRIGAATPATTVDIADAAARRCGVRVIVSDASRETDDELAGRLARLGVERVRALVPVSDTLRLRALDLAIDVDPAPVTDHGRVELPRWLKEQAVSETTHRYGRLTRSAEEPAGPARD